MSPKSTNTQDAEGQPARSTRADARRNEEAVLKAAKEVFATKGVDAPVREIAARAGVGVGTLYRRFPKRSDLVAAVFRREVDTCVSEAESLSAKYQAGEALSRWLQRYTEFITTKRGLAAALHSGDPAFDELPVYFRANFEPALISLLDAASSVGEIRTDIDAYNLLQAVASLSMVNSAEVSGEQNNMVNILIDGLRFGAASNKQVQ